MLSFSRCLSVFALDTYHFCNENETQFSPCHPAHAVSLSFQNFRVTLNEWNCYLLVFNRKKNTVWPLKKKWREDTQSSKCLLFHFWKWRRLSYHHHHWWNSSVDAVRCPLLIHRTFSLFFFHFGTLQSLTRVDILGRFSFNWFYANNLFQLIALCRFLSDAFELNDYFENVKKFWKSI